MATPNYWDNDFGRYSVTISYACTSFDSGRSVAQIHEFLRENGHPTLDIATVQRWLGVNGRSEPSPSTSSHHVDIRPRPANIRPTSANPQPANPQPANPQLAPSPLDAVTRRAPAVNHQPTDYQPTSSSISRQTTVHPNSGQDRLEVPLEGEALQIALDAHHRGDSIDMIRGELSGRRYTTDTGVIFAKLYEGGIRRFQVSEPER